MVKLANDFMMNVLNGLRDKGLTESSANAYVQRLATINGKKPFTTLAFLRKTEDVLNVIRPYADSTFKNFLTAVVSVLSLVKDKPTYKKSYQYYTNLLNEASEEYRDFMSKFPNHKTSKQEKNWVSWEEVCNKKNELLEKIKSFPKTITSKDFETLTQYLLLSLYTDIPPRRNQDYQLCYVVKDYNDDLPEDRNYLSLDNNTFYFNKYKTSKKYGQGKLEFNDNEPLINAIHLYLKYHPLNKLRKGKNYMYPLLVNSSGMPYTTVNSITRLLNKIFKKNVGSSMLRHIYLTSKYGDELDEMKKDSDAMGHSLATQKEYVIDKGIKPDANLSNLMNIRD